MGFFFAILPVCYMVSGLCVQLIPDKIDNRAILINAAFLNCISLLLIGPSKVLEFPDWVSLIGVGQFLCGLAMSFMNVLALPEMIR